MIIILSGKERWAVTYSSEKVIISLLFFNAKHLISSSMSLPILQDYSKKGHH